MVRIYKKKSDVRKHIIRKLLASGLVFLPCFSYTQTLLPDLSTAHVIKGPAYETELYHDVGIVNNQVIYKKNGGWRLGPILDVDSIKSISITDQRIIISDTAQIKVFLRSGDSWELEITLTPPEDGMIHKNYGSSIYSNDHIIVVSEDIPSAHSDSGEHRALIYTKQAGHWELDTALTLPVRIHRIRGIRNIKDELYFNNYQQDQLLVYKKTEGQWQKTQTIEAPLTEGPEEQQKFAYGFDVDRHILAISSYRNDYVQIYTRLDSQQPWEYFQTLRQSDFDSEDGQFGKTVELDGTTLLIGDSQLGKIYRFDLNLSGQWQYSTVIETKNMRDMSFSHGSLLVEVSNSAKLYTHAFPTVTLSGRVLTNDGVPLGNAAVLGYLQDSLTNEYGEYSLEVPLFWSGTLQAQKLSFTAGKNMGTYITSPKAIVTSVIRDTSVNDLVFEVPVTGLLYMQASYHGNCDDPNVRFAELPNDKQYFETSSFGRGLLAELPYGTSMTLTPVSEICQYSPESFFVDDMKEVMLYQVTATMK